MSILAPRWSIVYAIVLVAIGAISTIIIGTTINGQKQYETNRADNALVALEQACAQVKHLGAQCVTEPSQVTGDTGPPALPGPPGKNGQPGRPPTEAEIAVAVAAYLLANPPPAGEPGQQGDVGPSGMPCPEDGYHLQVLTVRLFPGGESIRGLFCVED